MTRVQASRVLKERYIWSLLVLTCIFPLPTRQQQPAPAPRPPQTAKELNIDKTDAGLECYVCTTMNGMGCASPRGNTNKIKCKDEYIKTVYGDAAFNDSILLDDWPPSLSDLVPPQTPPAPNVGWTYAKSGSATSVRQSGLPAGPSGSFKVSSLGAALAAGDSTFKKGFRSCRVMKISIASQVNDGKTYDLPDTKPRIVRTCSFVEKEGCKVINIKTATVEVCYCKTKACNGVSYLRSSQFGILLAFLLVLGAKIGQTMYY